jgi:hypothetical protein
MPYITHSFGEMIFTLVYRGATHDMETCVSNQALIGGAAVIMHTSLFTVFVVTYVTFVKALCA